jgi:hypothetical protein
MKKMRDNERERLWGKREGERESEEERERERERARERERESKEHLQDSTRLDPFYQFAIRIVWFGMRSLNERVDGKGRDEAPPNKRCNIVQDEVRFDHFSSGFLTPVTWKAKIEMEAGQRGIKEQE